jgi:hypothetical protein
MDREPDSATGRDRTVITLRDKATGSAIGTITEGQLHCLVDQLEEEDSDDQDYWLNRETVEMLRENGADADLVRMLEAAIEGREGFEVEWVRS